MNPIIKCEHTDFGYENHDAVIDLNLEIYPGDYLCVVGENGSGKSTLIKGILGLLKPTGGTLAVADELKRGGIGYPSPADRGPEGFPGYRTGGSAVRHLEPTGKPPVLLHGRTEAGSSQSGTPWHGASEKQMLPGAFRWSAAARSYRTGALCHRTASDPG